MGVLTVALVARYHYPLQPDSVVLLWYSRLDPLLLLSFLRWEGAVPDWGWLGIATLLFTLLAGRVFCGWLCPLGGFLAIIDSLKRQVRRLSDRGEASIPIRTKRLSPYRYLWLMLLLGVLLGGCGWGALS